MKEARFWNMIANYYSKKPIADEKSYQRKLEISRKYLKQEMKVLEFGCGTGSTAILHAPYVKQIRGIDISSKMIEIANQKLKNSTLDNVHFECATIENEEISFESLDAILGLSILHLVSDKDSVLKKIYQSLRPGGLFISSTVCISDSAPFFKFIAPVGWFLGILPLLRSFTKNDLLKSIEAAGFKIEEIFHPGKEKSVFLVVSKP